MLAPRGHAVGFRTGSMLHEPTRYALSAGLSAPGVFDRSLLTLVVTDDYGLPAWDANVTLSLVENGWRAASASLYPTRALLRLEDGGRLNATLTDWEAEDVVVTVRATGPYNEDSWTGHLDIAFRSLPDLGDRSLIIETTPVVDDSFAHPRAPNSFAPNRIHPAFPD